MILGEVFDVLLLLIIVFYMMICSWKLIYSLQMTYILTDIEIFNFHAILISSITNGLQV